MFGEEKIKEDKMAKIISAACLSEKILHFKTSCLLIICLDFGLFSGDD